jgi:hypothetical protein
LLSGLTALVAAVDGTLYAADYHNGAIRAVGRDGQLRTLTAARYLDGSVRYPEALDLGEYRPQQMAADSAGNIYFADSRTAWLRKITADGSVEAVETPWGRSPIWGIATGPGDKLYAVAGAQVWKRTQEGWTVVAGRATQPDHSGDGGPALDAEFISGGPLAVAGDGTVFLADKYGYVVRRVDAGGVITSVAGNRTRARFGDALDASQSSFFCDGWLPRIWRASGAAR